MLIGVLRKNLAEMLAVMEDTVHWLRERTGTSSDRAAMSASGVVGFTVCAPSGAELSQPEIRDGLAAVLEMGQPTAIYQLPQVTQNEVAPETAAWLAARYAHFYLLKDTSGQDRVALSGVDLQGVFLCRAPRVIHAGCTRAVGPTTASCSVRRTASPPSWLRSGTETGDRGWRGPFRNRFRRSCKAALPS